MKKLISVLLTVRPARVPEAARPKPADTLTYIGKTTAS